MSNLWRRYYPAPGDLRIAVEAHRDGSAIELQNGVPIFAKYYLIDEFDSPVLDPSCDWFATPNEAVFVAEIYAKLVDEGNPMPDRLFHSAYVRYVQIARRMPEFVKAIEAARISGGRVEYRDMVQALAKMLDA